MSYPNIWKLKIKKMSWKRERIEMTVNTTLWTMRTEKVGYLWDAERTIVPPELHLEKKTFRDRRRKSIYLQMKKNQENLWPAELI